MRKAFYEKLQELAARDRNVHVLTANLGYKFLDDIRATCKSQFLDVGVAEANMIGIASGLALSGKNVYCYSIIPFLVMRAYEQIRVDVAYHRLNVKLVGMGAGFTYGFEGFTHFGIEDLALMRAMPYMNVVVPDTIENAVRIAEFSYSYPEPLYIRLGRAGVRDAQGRATFTGLGRGAVLREGKDVAIVAIGNMVEPCLQAAALLAAEGITATVVNMLSLKPFDAALVRSVAGTHRLVVAAEEHSIVGGLGSAVAEVMAETPTAAALVRIGIPEVLDQVAGDVDYLWEHYGLSVSKIYARIKQSLG